MVDEQAPSEGFPHMEPPEVQPPKRTIPGALGCMTLILAALILIGLVTLHFYSMGNYSTELNVDGAHQFSGKLQEVRKVLFSDRYKLALILTNNQALILPPLPSPLENGKPIFLSIRPGTCVDGDLSVKGGFLRDLSLNLGDRKYHFDADAGWLVVTDTPVPE